MKLQLKKLLLWVSLIIIIPIVTVGCPTPGYYTIGPTGNYASISLAIADLTGCTLTGSYIFELQPTYLSIVESFPISIPFFSGGSLLNTITIRPQTGAGNLSITTSSSTGTLMLNAANYIFFDGRPGGTGILKNLSIENTNIGAAPAIQFLNDASNNSFQYCNIKSANNSATSGTIVFGIAGTGNGNDNNSIDNCDIYDAAAATPINAIYQSGSAAPKDNSSNTISNNKIYNFFSAASNMNGVLLADNASAWIISGNSFYQTATRNFTGTGNVFSAINTASNTVNGLTIINNYIGGTAPLATLTAMTFTGSGILSTINLIAGSGNTSIVTGNTIRNISFTSSAFGNNSLINLVSGKYNIGTAANPNILGSQSAINNISVSFSNSTAFPNNPVFTAITAGSGTPDNINISYNTIGGISLTGSSTTAYFLGIYFTGNTGTYSVNNNIIGSNTIVNSINSSLNNYLIAIWADSKNPAATHYISNNTIANIINSNTSSGNPLYGILAQGTSVYNISSNTLFNLVSASTSTVQSITGIYVNTPSNGGQTVSSNTIYNLYNTASTAAVGLSGIYYIGSATANNIVEKNFVHSLNLATSSSSGYIIGIYAFSGNATYKNNMVRLGINIAGNSITTGYSFNGLYDGTAAISNFFFNSVYIGGNNIASSVSSSFALYSKATGAKNYQNNIFFTARSNAVVLGSKHYACYLANNSSLTSNYNAFFATGTDAVLGFFTAVRPTLASWQLSTGAEINSIYGDPKFIAPNGNLASVDLHISNTQATVVESAGLAIAGITDDYDGQLRASLTATDIGADAGNFISVLVDVGALNLVAPSAASCYGNAMQVTVAVKNYDTQPIDFSKAPVTVTVNVTGTITQTLTGILNAGTLNAGATISINTSPLLNMSAAGTYNFNAVTSIGGTAADLITSNNAMPVDSRISIAQYTWTGLNTNWNNSSNWCGGLVPDNSTDIVIPDLGVGANYPIINSSQNAFAKNISIATNASILINDNGNFTISGSITNNGTITCNGLITLDGTTDCNFPDAGNLKGLNNLTINKTGGATVTFNKPFGISGIFTASTGKINVKDLISLRSTADSTARVAQVGATIAYNGFGKFEVQRYIPAKRAWRLLTSPLSSTTSIFNSWQNSGNYTAGKGTLVSGNGANPITNGLDISPLNNSSLKVWDTTTQSYTSISNSLTTLISSNTNPVAATNSGYFIFVRGDRNPVNTNTSNVNITTLNSTGFLQTGNQIFKAAAASGSITNRKFTLIGNPYASPIDFALIGKTNLLDQFYVWDPMPLEVGRFVLVMKSGSSYIMVPDRGVGGPNQFIQSSQAFFVETGLDINTAPTLSINETNKTGNNNLGIFRPMAMPVGMRINLYRKGNAANPALLADGLYAMFDNSFSKAVTNDEPAKFTNINENIALIRDNQILAIEKRPLVEKYDTLFLRLSKTSRIDYNFEMIPSSMKRENGMALLEDNYLNTKTNFELNSNATISFNINSDPLSSAVNRFRVVFRPVVDFENFTAQLNNADVQINWDVANEYKTNHFEIERSIDGIHFQIIGLLQSANNLSTKNSYHFTDVNPTGGIYHYRIKAITENGKVIFTDVKKISIINKKVGIFVFPNPIENGIIHLQMNDQLQGNYNFRLINKTGQIVYTKTFENTQMYNSITLQPTTVLLPGNYFVEIIDENKKIITLSVLVN